VRVARIDGGITVDGDVSDSAWQCARRVDTFGESIHSIPNL
jgi:hypothetical protein